MIFITLGKFKVKPAKEINPPQDKLIAEMAKHGVKILSIYWTLGSYDAVAFWEAKDEKTLMKALISLGDVVSTETLVAIPREEALKLLE